MKLGDISKRITISGGNMKLGKIPNISLPPVVTCHPAAGCRRGDCYALKAYRTYRSARGAWDGNLATYQNSPTEYFDLTGAWLDKKQPGFFRWHVSGDIPDKRYLSGILGIAEGRENTRFLLFTKKYAMVNRVAVIPQNLSIVFSAWPGLRMNNPHQYPVAWMDDGTDKRIPIASIPCPGNCENCGMCWSLKKIGKDVVFKKH